MGNKRLLGIDVIRSIAIACVVLCHAVVGTIYTFDVIFMQSMSFLSRAFAFTAFSIGRIGVPFFLLISGYLLLDRKYDDVACKKFWKTKCLGLLFSIEVWNILYNIFDILFFHREITIDTMMKQLFLVKASSMNHMWYMPMILGMYLTLPIIANALKELEIKTLLIPYSVLFVLAFGIPVLNEFSKLSEEKLGTTVISMGFSGGCYGLYLIGGYLLKKGLLKKYSSGCLMSIAGINFFSVVFMQLYMYDNGVVYNVWYDNLFLYICGICLFEVLLRIKQIPFKKLFKLVAKYSFAIYLVHNPINQVLKVYIVNVGNKPVHVMIIWISTMILSFIISYLISKIPKIGKMILYMK